MKIIHIETQVTTVLGVLDDDGDVVQTIQIKTDGKDSFLIHKLNVASFEAALHGVLSVRDKLQTELDEKTKNANNIIPPSSNN